MRLLDSVPCLAVVLCLLACRGKSVDEAIAENRAGVTVNFSRIAALRAAVDAAPKLDGDRVLPAGEPVVVQPASKKNAMIVHAEDLREPGSKGAVPLRITGTGELLDCGSILATKKYASGGDALGKVADEYLRNCAAVRYLFVVRTREHRAPAYASADTFTPGKFVGDVLLYRVDDKSALGGFRIDVESSDVVTVTKGNRDGDRLGSDFSANVFVAVQDGIRRYVPGALPPK